MIRWNREALERGYRMTVEHKTARGEVKQIEETGEFEAVIATLGVIDSDGDIIEPGAFGNATVSILPAHNKQSVPLGKGRVEERGNEAIVIGRFNLESQAAKEWRSALLFDMANPPAVQEWSFGYFVRDALRETREGTAVRVLKQLEVFEVSLVVAGAGQNTRTLAVKEKVAGKLSRLGEAMDAVIDEVTMLRGRREATAKNGGKAKSIGKAHQAKIDALIEQADTLGDALAEFKQLARARRPVFDSTESTTWSAPTLDTFKASWDGDKDFETVADAPQAFRNFVARHSLLGDPSAETLREVMFFPVVRPASRALNENALRAVLSGRGSQANVGEDALESAQAMARRLLETEFDGDDEGAESRAAGGGEAPPDTEGAAKRSPEIRALTEHTIAEMRRRLD